MATDGPNDPATGAGANWANRSNGFASDNTYATDSVSGGPNQATGNLDYTNFSHSTSGTVDGVTIAVEAQHDVDATFGGVDWDLVQLIIGGSPTGDDKATGGVGTSDATDTFGGAADDWTTGITSAQANASNYGVRLRLISSGGSDAGFAYTAKVDHVTSTMDYTAAGGSTVASMVPVARPGTDAPGMGIMNNMRYRQDRTIEMWRPSPRKISIPGLVCLKRILEGVFQVPVGGSTWIVKG